MGFSRSNSSSLIRRTSIYEPTLSEIVEPKDTYIAGPTVTLELELKCFQSDAEKKIDNLAAIVNRGRSASDNIDKYHQKLLDAQDRIAKYERKLMYYTRQYEKTNTNMVAIAEEYDAMNLQSTYTNLDLDMCSSDDDFTPVKDELKVSTQSPTSLPILHEDPRESPLIHESRRSSTESAVSLIGNPI